MTTTTTSAPDPFALGGRHDDPILALVAEWRQKYAQANNPPEDLDNDARDEWVAQMTEVAGDALWDALEASPPVSVEGVIALVDVLLSKAIGIVGELWTDGRDQALCEQILAGLHGLKGRALAGNAAPGRQGMTPELYRLIAEYRSIEDASNATPGDVLPGVTDAMRAALYKINAIRPTTLAGVMAALDFADECDEDPAECWPKGAIEGLRTILAGVPQPDGSILITQPDGSQGYYTRRPNT